jgi:AMP phosphorylase
MILKIKVWDWSAGLPVAMLNKKTAETLSVHPEDRLNIKTIGKKRKEVSTLIDTINDHGLVKEDEIADFEFQNGQKVEVSPTNLPDSLVFIKKKLGGSVLSGREIRMIIEDVVNNSLSEAEIALFISAVYKYGMNIRENITEQPP